MEWLADVTYKTILVLVGAGMQFHAATRLSGKEAPAPTRWTENVEVVLSMVVVLFLIIHPFLFQAFFIPSPSMEPTLHGPPDHPIGDRLLVDKLIYRFADPRRSEIAVFRAPPHADPDEKDFIKRVVGIPNDTIEVVPPRLLVDDKIALRLTSEADEAGQAGWLSVEPEELPLHVNGRRIQLPSGTVESPVTVIVDPRPAVRFDPYRVEVGGKVLLTDDSGGIQARHRIRAYGAEKAVNGSVYLIEGEPRLFVIRGNRLAYAPGKLRVNGRDVHEPYVHEPPAYGLAPQRLGPGEYFMMGDNRNNSNDSHHWGALKRERFIGRAEVRFWPLDRIAVFHWWLLIVLAVLYSLYLGLSHVLVSRPRS
jgi:signal peptidase I